MSEFTVDQQALKAHIELANAKMGGSLETVSDPSHWERCGVTTIQQFEHYNASECYINLYEDANGIKPRWINFDELSVEEIQQMIGSEFSGGDEVETRSVDTYVPNTPFAGLKDLIQS